MTEAEREEVIQKVAEWRLEREYSKIVHVLGNLKKEELGSDPVFFVELAAALGVLLRNDEGLRILIEGRDKIQQSGDQKLCGRYLLVLSTQLRYSGRTRIAKRISDELLVAAFDQNDERLLASLYNGLGIDSAMIGDVDRAMTWFSRAIAVWQRLGDKRHVGLGHYNRGLVANLWQRTSEAAQSFALAQEYYERGGTIEEMICVRSSRALVAMIQGDQGVAAELIDWSLENLERVESISLRASVLSAKGKLCSLSEDLTSAAFYFYEALAFADRTGDVFDRAEIAGELAVTLRRTGEVDSAKRYLNKAIERYQRFGGHAYARRISHQFASIR